MIREGELKSIGDVLKDRLALPAKKGQATRHQQLAVEIAEEFYDMKHIGIYMKICKKFDENYVRRILGLVREIRPSNPGPYFTKLIFKKDL